MDLSVNKYVNDLCEREGFSFIRQIIARLRVMGSLIRSKAYHISTTILAAFLLSLPVHAQESNQKLIVKYTSANIKIDGSLDEDAWKNAEAASNFWQFFPTDSVHAKFPTDVKLLYNDNTLFIGIVAKTAGGNFVVSSLRRDFSGPSSDNVSLVFDTFSDGTNAFLFGVTPYGVQRDAYLSGGGASLGGFNSTWDIKWKDESRMYDDHYVVEIAIPFSSLKFKGGATQWRFQTYRWNIQSSEQSAWVRVPQNQPLSSLAFMGILQFEKPLGKSGTPFAVIPYVNALARKDFETDEAGNKIKTGGDAKVAIGSSMNLDVTVNPDFSNVEVDDIFTNLTRFEVFLPEKRQFFIDNSDIFGSFGSPYMDENTFFSRRIGLARDTSGNLIENRIIGGARLSGNINQDWRLGVLDVQTAEDAGNRIPSNNNMMIALQRKIFARSNIGVFFINRQALKSYDFLPADDKYNRVAGIDYNLYSKDNKVTGKFYLHKSFQPGDNKGNLSSQATVTYNSRYYELRSDFVYIDQDFRSELGFVPRTNVFKSVASIQRSFYPDNGDISRHSVQFMSSIYWKPVPDFKRTDHTFQLSYDFAFTNQSTLQFEAANQFIYLTYGFDPARKEGSVPLPGNTGYHFNQLSARYQSNPARTFSFNVSSEAGQFFNGYNTAMTGTFSFRWQPWVLMSMALNYNAIRLPEPYSKADLWLVSPKIDITFSKSLFWSTLVQYSNQRENLGINSRLQWRFAPLSDLYLVYNDNYNTTSFAPRFRSINLKLTYWLNL